MSMGELAFYEAWTLQLLGYTFFFLVLIINKNYQNLFKNVNKIRSFFFKLSRACLTLDFRVFVLLC